MLMLATDWQSYIDFPNFSLASKFDLKKFFNTLYKRNGGENMNTGMINYNYNVIRIE